MTHVIFRENGNHFMFSERGHCGNSLVCAACSTLAQTLMQGVCDLQSLVASTKACKAEPGAVSIDVLATDDGRNTLHTIFHLVERGFLALEKKYPDCVAVGRKA